jgi:diaminohydroxyphosphoribosylaminopyrimidine deaminase / 5-amino-6-(5-phosphoribosylamino)uracil reductase
MHRCLELASQAEGHVAPNPMVGAVLVHEDRIIGEGYHRQYGQAHAEVNCIESVADVDKDLISSSAIYVSLEPCAHFGKTPPCADLIIRHKIPTCIIGCRDPFEEVDGKGIEKLQAAGVNVKLGILERECKELNKRFFTYHIQKRPYVVLKWAQTADGFMAPRLRHPARNDAPEGETLEYPAMSKNGSRLYISNEYSNRLVHKWRSEEGAILVGTNTALLDNPELTTRLWTGPSPVRLVLDMNLRLPSSLKLFNGAARTIVFNLIKQEEKEKENVLYYQLNKHESVIQQMMNALYELKITSVLVEGGSRLLQSFIDENMWDEIRRITNTQMTTVIATKQGNGLQAPVMKNAKKVNEINLAGDSIEIFKNNE